MNLSIVPQWNHILDDDENYLRIPAHLRENGKSVCRTHIAGAIDNVKRRIQANYKTAVPQCYKGNIQLLAPLYLINDEQADLALVLLIESERTQYYSHTCLTIEMAYHNARLIAHPDGFELRIRFTEPYCNFCGKWV